MFLGRVFSRFYFRHHNIFPSSFVTEAEKFGWSFVFEMFVAKEVAEKITQSVKGKFWGSPLTMLKNDEEYFLTGATPLPY